MLTIHPNSKPWHPSPTSISYQHFSLSSKTKKQVVFNTIRDEEDLQSKIKRLVLSQEGRTKLDFGPDREFYAYPRFVTHVDDKFISTLTNLYRDKLRPDSEILDLMSSWVSHLPEEVKYKRVVGHGLNAQELARNPRLHYFFVKDLNQDHKFELESCSFDAVLCTVSVQYLQHPEKTSDWAQQEEEEAGEERIQLEAKSTEGEVEEEGEYGAEKEEEDSYPEPPEEAKLFVGNLPYDYDSEKLAQLFNQAGVVEIAEVIYNRQTDQSRGFGFVTMSTVEEAEKAVEMFNRYDVSGRFLTVNKAAPKGSQPEKPRVFEPSFRIYVGNLPWQVDNGRLEQLFSEHGKVVDARVVYDRESGRSRGFGFVTMASETELNDAIAALDGQSLDGRAIRVNVAEERPRRSFF